MANSFVGIRGPLDPCERIPSPPQARGRLWGAERIRGELLELGRARSIRDYRRRPASSVQRRRRRRRCTQHTKGRADAPTVTYLSCRSRLRGRVRVLRKRLEVVLKRVKDFLVVRDFRDRTRYFEWRKPIICRCGDGDRLTIVVRPTAESPSLHGTSTAIHERVQALNHDSR